MDTLHEKVKVNTLHEKVNTIEEKVHKLDGKVNTIDKKLNTLEEKPNTPEKMTTLDEKLITLTEKTEYISNNKENKTPLLPIQPIYSCHFLWQIRYNTKLNTFQTKNIA